MKPLGLILLFLPLVVPCSDRPPRYEGPVKFRRQTVIGCAPGGSDTGFDEGGQVSGRWHCFVSNIVKF